MNRWFSTIVLCAAASAATGAALSPDEGAVVRYDGFKLLRAYPQSWGQIDQLHDLGVLLHSDYEGIGPVDYLVPPGVMAGVEAMGVSYDMIKENVQRDIDAERARLNSLGPADPRDPDWFNDFKDLDAINAKMNAWVADYPDIAELYDIGDSIEGRDIWALRITGPGDDKPGVLMNATQHAREWIAPMVDMYIADHLVENYGSDPRITALVDAVEIWFIPCVNPDGYQYSWDHERYWRKNRRDIENSPYYGVDLNRNWETGWGGGGSSGSPSSETYRGTAPFSEPCTQAMRDYYQANPNLVASIDFHSHGEYVLYPWGYQGGGCGDNGLHHLIGQEMRTLIQNVHGVGYALGSCYDTLYQASGVSVDWSWDDQEVLSYTIELRGPDFVIDPSEIIPNSEEILPAALYLIEWWSTPVHFSFPDGVPSQLEAGVETVIPMSISVSAGAPIDPGTEMVLYRVGTSGPFTEELLDDLGDDDYEATLPALDVGQVIQFYFQVETTDNVVYTSPDGAPDALYEAGVVEVAYRWDLSTDPGWTTESQWAYGHPTGGGGEYGYPDPTSGYTGSNVYGYNLNGDYSNSMPEYHLTTTAIDCSDLTQVQLKFWRWLGVEQPAYDHAYIRVSNDGQNWTTVWSNSGTIEENSWTQQACDLSSVADNEPTVYVRWTMGTTDSGWRYCGWNIDDVEIWGVTINPCPADLNTDGVVDIDDLFEVLAHWGEDSGPYDINQDGVVDIDDLFAVLADWGPC